MAAEEFKAARDFLLAHRTDYATAYRDFRWPAPTHFNWALDWFDAELANDAVDGLYRTLGVAARVSPDRSGCRVELRLRSAEQLAGLVERLAALEATP